jgi:sugar phosphate isomerase/epimerase
MAEIRFSVFTKPWKTRPIEQVGAMVKSLHFEGVELPVRPGFQVEPENVERDLPRVARTLREMDVEIFSVAGPTDEATIRACAEAEVPIIRTMARIGQNERYLDAVARIQREYEALVPLLDESGVTIGVQNHCGRFVPNALGLLHLLEPFETKHVAAVWDAAHEALNGSDPDLALDVIWDHLCMINFKNAIWQQTNGPESEVAQWRIYWTDGRHGLASWPRLAEEIHTRGYQGVICLTAEYSSETDTHRLLARDMAFAHTLVREHGG